MVARAMDRFRNQTAGEKLFTLFLYSYAAFTFLAVAYPLYFIVIASVSDPNAVAAGQVWLAPRGFNLEGYKAIFAYEKLWIGYRNTVFYAAAGTAISLLVTIPAGYALSRRDFLPRKAAMFFFTFTMFFSGGLIPTYILISKLHLNNTVWVMLIPFCLNVYNLIITRSYFESTLPAELLEAARLDGCGDGAAFLKVVLPLSKAIVAVVALYYLVASWNNYFRPMIYIKDLRLQTLQVFLRDILIQNELLTTMSGERNTIQDLADMIKYGIIVVSALPMLVAYPFVQRYFVKGVMIGSIKG